MGIPEQQSVAELSARVEFLEEKIMDALEAVKENQERMGADIAKIKEAVYNPDSGLYARLRELENWKETSSRLLWMLITSVVTLTVATIYKSLG